MSNCAFDKLSGASEECVRETEAAASPLAKRLLKLRYRCADAADLYIILKSQLSSDFI